MIQFRLEDIHNLKDKAKNDPSVIQWLKDKVDVLVQHGIKVPQEGIATWTLYYYCPKHSVELDFNIQNSEQHICPVDGEVFTGEPYVGAWWRILNGINSEGCNYLALLWLLTGDSKYRELAKTILMEYSKYYPGYEEHGGIPHNGPGKANCQTLCEALWIRDLAKGYDIIKDTLTSEEICFIENNLFAPCAEFLKEHRTHQIHNHEVVIGGAIGILGVLLERRDLIDYAVNSRYGLKYQLQNAVLKDCFWFEGGIHYHYFALQAFFIFEKFVRYTNYGLLNNATYRKMLKFPIMLMQPDYKFPSLNDGFDEYIDEHLPEYYEFPYSVFGDKEFAWMLNKIYESRPRNNLEAFIYGVEDIPKVEGITLEDYHNGDGSGITVFRGDKKKYLLVRHGPFGGEHDHYDRLGISLLAYGCRIAPDLGTTGYGAKLHYDYYKNTGTHNTVVINEENQPPANGSVIKYEKHKDYILLDTEAKWDGSFKELDTHTRVEWDEESYSGVYMRRAILWCDEYFIEIFKAAGVKNRTIDWVLHVCGQLGDNPGAMAYPGIFSSKKPFKYIKDVKFIKPAGKIKTTWAFDSCELNLYSCCADSNTVYYGNAPDNPSIEDISYIINRVVGDKALFINVFEVCEKKRPIVKDIDVILSNNDITVKVVKDNGIKEYLVSI